MSLTVFTKRVPDRLHRRDPVEGATVIVEDEPIKDVRARAAPARARAPWGGTIDCAGATLMPASPTPTCNICA